MFTNTYFLSLFITLTAFIALVLMGANSDAINLLSRLYVFGGLGYVGARYVGRAPVLMWRNDLSSEARNIVGFAIFLLAVMMQQVFAWLYISYDRPTWLSSSYWSPSFVVLAAVGLTFVASSVPRFPPFGRGPQGLSVWSSFLVALTSALGLWLAAHFQHVFMAIKAILVSGSHAL